MAKQINVKEELISKGMAEGGLVAFARSNNGMMGAYLGGMMGSAIQMATAKHYAIVKSEDKILVIPYKKGEILYDKTEVYAKEDILKAKLSWTSKFKIKMRNGKKRVVYIEMFPKDLKEILKQLDLLK